MDVPAIARPPLARVTSKQFGDVPAVFPRKARETEFGLGPDDVVIRGEDFRNAPALAAALGTLADVAQSAGWTVNFGLESSPAGESLTVSMTRPRGNVAGEG